MVQPFSRLDGELYVEGLPLADLAARFGTPLYVYSQAAISARFKAYQQALAPGDLVCFAVKANSNLAVLNLLAKLGAGFDIVSGGELSRVLAAGGDPARVVFSGVGKQAGEMRQALEAGVLCFNVESEPELALLESVAQECGRIARISIRVNPEVDAGTHPYISTGMKENKFGVAADRVLPLYRQAQQSPWLSIQGIDCHIGSQLTELSPFMDALDRVIDMIEALACEGMTLSHLDFGGGLGVTYANERPPSPAVYLEAVRQRLQERCGGALQGLKLIVEPGRSIVANAGVLLTEVLFLKHHESRNFAVVDAAMNDLIRPALYDAWMAIEAVRDEPTQEEKLYDIVGPVCETADFLGKQRALRIAPGALLAVRSAGAYGAVMSSNYNTRGRAAEVLVSGQQVHLARAREQIADLLAHEQVLPADWQSGADA